MKKSIIQKLAISLLFFIPQILLAQQESWNWYFGGNAGINFSTGSPVALTNNAFSTIEGVATISDNNGNLLFYTDGSNVYNANHVTMPNGTGLLGNPSSTQSAIIVKKPGSNNLYYIFTVDYNHENTEIIGTGFCYSVADMSLNSGLGDIIASEKNILIRQRAYEKLTAVLHGNSTDFWIIINDWVDDAIYSYHLSSSGLDNIPVISNVGIIHNHTLNTLGYIKASKQSNRLALARLDFNSFAVLDFDNNTGIASNRIDINGTSITLYRVYGVEFSPDGTKLYGSTLGVPFKTIQFDLTSGIGDTIYKYRTVLDSSNVTLSSCNYYFGTLQLGPDGKIYGVVQCDSFLTVINSPDSFGISCNYESQAVSLSGRLGQLGLPNFVTSDVLPSSIADASISEANDFVIYPNPTSDYLTLSIKNKVSLKNTSYLIFDVLGNIILRSFLTTGLTRIELNNLSNGIYFLQINYDGIFVNRKFVITR